MPVSGSHNAGLVALSVLIAITASYTALDLAGRVRMTEGRARFAWLATAGLAMGGGIWAMHFVAMLAFRMPGMTIAYDGDMTAVSLLVPVLATSLSFLVVTRRKPSAAVLVTSGLCMGLSIVVMHYLGMAAMRLPADLTYETAWVVVSVIIAEGAATVALWWSVRTSRPAVNIAAAVVMGLAIAGMHFASMEGARFSAHPGLVTADASPRIGQATLALAVAGSTFLILFLALVAAMFDRRFAVLAEREARALRLSEERFRSLYTKTPLPLFSLDREGRIEHVGDAWLALVGHGRPEVVGRALASFMADASARQFTERDWPRLLDTGRLAGCEYRIVTRDGRLLDVLASAEVARDAEGGFKRVLGGWTDNTERKLAEDALRQAQKIEAVGQLTGGVAHDFNNLLAVVIGNLELLRKRVPEDERTLRLIDSALQGAQRGASLTQRMLAFARRQDLRPKPVDVPDLVRGMADLLRRSLGPGVRIETRFPPDLARAHVDANQLELALLNLAVNARDAMPEGGTLAIAAFAHGAGDEDEGAAGGFLCLSVQDTGQGMDEAVLRRALEPFFTTKGIGKGTGLGLSMVHGLAAQSGGRLVLRSAVGQGTTAELWLPIAIEDADAGREGNGEAAPRATAVTPPLTILVVDDDALVLANTAAMLEDLGHTVLQAGHGPDALAMVTHGRAIRMLITDHAMPGMTGLQLADAARTLRPTLPILIVSGYTDLPEHTARFPRLAKPFSQTALAEAVAAAALAAEEQVARPRPVEERPRQRAGGD